jgi:hypothetical protein
MKRGWEKTQNKTEQGGFILFEPACPFRLRI